MASPALVHDSCNWQHTHALVFLCVDVDECAGGTSNCSQLCNNTLGSYECSCNIGYMLDSNGFTCSGTCMYTQ